MNNTEQCVWLSDDFSWVCVNDESDYCTDFVDEEICGECKYREFK